jgi:hypothetical protein
MNDHLSLSLVLQVLNSSNLSRSGNFEANSGSPYAFYDKGCLTAGPSSSSKATTTSKAPISVSSSSPATSTSCGLTGYDKNNPVSFADSNKAADLGVTGCATLCQSTNGCNSFALSTQTCYLYNKPLAGNFKPDSSSPYKFYDLACVSAIPSSSSSKASPSTTSTSSSRISATSSRSTTSSTVSGARISSSSSSRSSSVSSSSLSKCHNDLCYKAVKSADFGVLSLGYKECQSFLLSTVTYSTS